MAEIGSNDYILVLGEIFGCAVQYKNKIDNHHTI